MSLGDVFLSYDGNKFRVLQVQGRERELIELSAEDTVDDAIKQGYNAMYAAPGRELRLGLQLNRWTVSK